LPWSERHFSLLIIAVYCLIEKLQIKFLKFLRSCNMNEPISKELLDILACPKCKGDIRLTSKKDGLVCEKCRLVYLIKDGIPIMLIDEAISLNGYQEGTDA